MLASVNAISDATKRAAKLTARSWHSVGQIVAEVLDINAIVTAVIPMVDSDRQVQAAVVELDPATGHVRADAGQTNRSSSTSSSTRDAMPDGGRDDESGNAAFDDFHAPGYVDGA